MGQANNNPLVKGLKYHLSSNRYITRKKICNGVADCKGLEDETSCPGRFYCTNSAIPHIANEKVCNGKKDCSNGKDEQRGWIKELNIFCCGSEENPKILLQKQICDGFYDCSNGFDECQPGCIDSVFSNEKSMIKDKKLLAFVWILGLVSSGGNILVMIMMFRKLIEQQKRKNTTNKIAKFNAVLLLSLSFSDFLVGIYIIAICAKSVEVEGKYCFVDHEWRSSAGCSFLGFLLVVGSQSSVFTMVLITVMRMLATLKPFWDVGIKLVLSSVFGTWALSITIGCIPLIPYLENYFVDSIWFANNQFFNNVEKKNANNITKWLSFYFQVESNDVGSWSTLEKVITNFDYNLTNPLKFGYYSTHTVCLPTFFPKREKDEAWSYSLMIILINFLAFFFIAVGYAMIFRTAVKPNQAVAPMNKARLEQNTRMQRKLMRIVGSDFFCWMPVSIMAFLQLGGIEISDDSYLPVGLIIIPINSALNPFLYSNLPDVIWGKMIGSYGRVRAALAMKNGSIQKKRSVEIEKEIIEMRNRVNDSAVSA